MEELGHDVESKEVAIDPLSTHRCLQQSLVLIHRQAEQGEALCVLGPPRGGHRSWKDRKWAYCWGLSHPRPQPSLQLPCKAEISTPLRSRDTGTERGSHLPRVTQQGRIRWVPRYQGPKLPSLSLKTSRGEETEVPAGF